MRRRSAVLSVGFLGLGCVAATADVSVTFVVDSAWADGYNARIEIQNTGSTSIDGWELSYVDGPEISSLWNADWQVVGDQTTLTNLDWNGTITAGAVVEIGFGGVGSFTENVNQATFNGEPITII